MASTDTTELRDRLQATLGGAYTLGPELGGGGMSRVFAAEETALGRRVVVKVLPPELAGEVNAERFKREIRLVGQLHHPHVVPLLSTGESEGLLYYTMPYIDGESLRGRLDRLGEMSVGEVVKLLRDIADALAYAHRRGVVHRDLKPENILLAEGHALVADFGVAKALSAAGASTLTSTGVTLGTPAYMAPEQAAAEPLVDSRADLYSLGVVAYEMLTGHAPFVGRPAQAVLAAHLAEAPEPIARRRASIPPSLAALVMRCLEKRPADRPQSAEEVEAALALEGARPTSAATRIERAQSGRWLWAVAAVLACLGLGAVGATLLRRDAQPSAHAIRASVLVPADPASFQFPAGRLAISPDGRLLVFAAGGRLWLRPIDAVEAQPLPGTEGAISPFWSPDGHQLGFFTDGKLKRIDLAGGPPNAVTDSAGGLSGAWNHENVIVFGRERSGIWRVSSSGGTPVPVTTLDTTAGEIAHQFPHFLPDGRHFLYLAIGSRTGSPWEARGVFVGSLDGGEPTRLLLTGGSNVAYSNGYLLFLQDAALMAQPLDLDRIALTGDAALVGEHIQTSARVGQSTGAFAASSAGLLVYQSGPSRQLSRLTWTDRDGTDAGVLGEEAEYSALELSPDARHAAVAMLDRASGNRDIWLFDLARGVRTRVTSGLRDVRALTWSPDGRRLAFRVARDGRFDLYQVVADGVSREQRIWSDTLSKYPSSWSPDGRVILYHTGRSTLRTGEDLWVLPLAGDRKPYPFVQTRFNELEGRFSPDGRWVVFQSDETGRNEVYVMPFPGRGGKWRISIGGGHAPRWRRDGKEIFYLAPGDTLMAAAVRGQDSTFEVGTVRPLFVADRPDAGFEWDVSADGRRFLFNTRAEPTGSPITLVVNWTAGLRRPR